MCRVGLTKLTQARVMALSVSDGAILCCIGSFVPHTTQTLRYVSHCGGMVICRSCDPPQAWNPASEMLSYIRCNTVLTFSVFFLVFQNSIFYGDMIREKHDEKKNNHDLGENEKRQMEVNDPAYVVDITLRQTLL